MNAASALYCGRVMHQRVRPVSHRLRYRVFWLLLDLDEICAIDARLRLFSQRRFNLLSFDARDHGDGSDLPLRDQVQAMLAPAGIDLGGGPVRLLTMPRILGYAFNPISLYYCHRADGQLVAVVYEVTSTFGERHSYVTQVTDGGAFRHEGPKKLYVSPFLEMDMRYLFEGSEPGERLALRIRGGDRQGPLIFASISARRRPLTDRALLGACLAMPLLTVKVVAAIHWEAVKLWWKRVPLTRRPSLR